MKNYLYYAVFAFLSVWRCWAHGQATNDWGPLTNNVKMSICLAGPEPVIKSNGLVELQFTITNVSRIKSYGVTSLWGTIESDPHFSFSIVTPSGKKIVAQLPADLNRSEANYILTPNKATMISFILSKRFKFDEIGNYTIIAMRIIDLPPEVERGILMERGFTVVSNPLSVNIVSDR